MASNAVKATVKLLVKSGKAAPSPAIGQALGPLGLNMMDFCKQFNERTKDMVPDIPTPVVLTAFNNRTFSFECKLPPTSWFVKRCAGIELGGNLPGREFAGKITLKQIYEIALVKKSVTTDVAVQEMDMESCCRMVMGSANTCGVEVVRGSRRSTPHRREA